MKSGGTKMQRAFVIRPFGKKTDASGTSIDFEQVHEHLIAPALKDAGLGGGTIGEIIDAGNVHEDMFPSLSKPIPRRRRISVRPWSPVACGMFPHHSE
jgi:hypothetical protein